MPRAVRVLAGLLASGLLPGSSALGQSTEPPPAGERTCAQEAQQATSLDEGNAFLLCGGASSTAPVECFERVEEAAMLPTPMALALCQCATSLAPVDCFRRLARDTMLSKKDIVTLCAPAATNPLWPACPALRPAY